MLRPNKLECLILLCFLFSLICMSNAKILGMLLSGELWPYLDHVNFTKFLFCVTNTKATSARILDSVMFFGLV